MGRWALAPSCRIVRLNEWVGDRVERLRRLVVLCPSERRQGDVGCAVNILVGGIGIRTGGGGGIIEIGEAHCCAQRPPGMEH